MAFLGDVRNGFSISDMLDNHITDLEINDYFIGPNGVKYTVVGSLDSRVLQPKTFKDVLSRQYYIIRCRGES